MIKLSIVQFEPKYKDLNHNLNRIKQIILGKDSINNVEISQNKIITSDSFNSDIIIFPEMSLSGYFFDDREELKRYAVDKLFLESKFQTMATNLNKVIILGFAEIEYLDVDLEGDLAKNYKLYNSSILISPNPKETKVYRKSHLFYKENIIFDKSHFNDTNTNGEQNSLTLNYIKHLDLSIGSLICYDWRFPEISRKYALLGADLLVCPANLVTKLWKTSLPARALDNRVFFAVSNRIGTETLKDEQLYFTGCSGFYDTEGKLIGQLSEKEENILNIEFDHIESKNKKINSFNDIFDDLRPDLY